MTREELLAACTDWSNAVRAHWDHRLTGEEVALLHPVVTLGPIYGKNKVRLGLMRLAEENKIDMCWRTPFVAAIQKEEGEENA